MPLRRRAAIENGLAEAYSRKLIYIEFPGYPVFVATDYACRIFSLAFLYLLLRNEPTSLPMPCVSPCRLRENF